MKNRCDWCVGTFDDYLCYHDNEWGVPVHNDRTLFEFLLLETAQAGLSWSTILKKRAGYRDAFAGFDANKVARFDDQKIQQLLENPAIIRNKLKVRSAVNNARQFLAIQEQFGSFDRYLWSFVEHEPIQNSWQKIEQIPASTPLSETLAHDLKQRGFSFVGSTTMYAYMQAVGLVNDHITSCFRYQEIKNIHH